MRCGSLPGDITGGVLANVECARAPVALKTVTVLGRRDRGRIVERMAPGVINIRAETFPDRLTKAKLPRGVCRIRNRGELIDTG